MNVTVCKFLKVKNSKPITSMYCYITVSPCSSIPSLSEGNYSLLLLRYLA